MIPLTDQEISELARYNSEKARGLLHTEAWTLRMRRQQARFNEQHNGPVLSVAPAVVFGIPWWRRWLGDRSTGEAADGR